MRCCLVFSTLAALLSLSVPAHGAAPGATGRWERVPSPVDRISGESIDRLFNGDLLIAGGWVEENKGRPSTRVVLLASHGRLWRTPAQLPTPRQAHQSARLSNGDVLLAGGEGPGGIERSTVVFRANKGTWKEAAPMKAARIAHTLTPLKSGAVLAIGGRSTEYIRPGTALATGEIYAPSQDVWVPVADMSAARSEHAAIQLPDERVMVLGGVGSKVKYVDDIEADENVTNDSFVRTVVVFEPKSGRWADLAALPFHVEGPQLFKFLGNQIIVVATSRDASDRVVPAAAVYDPTKNLWQKIDIPPTVRLGSPQAVLPVSSHELLFVGWTKGSTTAYLFDASAGTWKPFPSAPWGGATELFRFSDRSLILKTYFGVARYTW